MPFSGHARLLIVAGVLALSACPSPPVPRAVALPPRVDPACEEAARARARVPGLLGEGKLDRAVRVIHRADQSCPKTAPLTWAELAETLLALGRVGEAEALAGEIERSEQAAPRALQAARAVRERAPLQRAEAPDPEGLYAKGLAAKGKGETAEAQRLFDRALVDLERAAQAETGKAVGLSLDTPNGLSSRCLCDYRSPPACTCGEARYGDPKADPLDAITHGNAWAIAWSHNGRLFAASHGERVFVFDARTMRERFHLEGHTAFVRALAFAPDDRSLVSAADDRTARRWDLATGRELTRLTSDGSGFTALAYPPAGSPVTVGTGHGGLYAWDTATSEDVHEGAKDRCNVDLLSWSADSRTLAARRCRQEVLFLEASGLKERTDFEHGLDAFADGVAWSPRGRTLAFANGRAGLQLFEPDRGTKRTLAKESKGLVAWSPDGARLATSGPGTIFDLATSERHEIPLPRYGTHAMVYSPDGRTLATSGEYDGSVRFWDGSTGAVWGAIRRHSPAVRALALSPDGASLASAWGDGKLRLLDAATGRVRWMAEPGLTDALAFAPDGHTLASVSAVPDGNVYGDRGPPFRIVLWDPATGARGVELAPNLGVFRVAGLAWSRDGKMLAAGGGQQVLRWSVPDWKPLPSLSTWCSNDGLKACVVDHVAFSPDGHTLLTNGHHWDAASGEEQKERRTAAMVLAHPGDRGLMDLLDMTANSRPTTVWSGMWMITSAAFQPEAQLVAVGRKDMTVTLLDGIGAKSLGVLHGHSDAVNVVMWTEDGHVLISAGEDGEIRFWSPQGSPLAVLRVVEGTSSSYVFTEGASARLEVFGADARLFPLCRAGRETLPFEACAERFGVKGLLAAALAQGAINIE